MTLPTSGALSASMINTELGRVSNALFSINGASERGLAAKPSGVVSFANFRGKSYKIREPATGEYYESNTLYWETTNLKNNESFNIIWFGYLLFSTGVLGNPVEYDYDGWRYHRGTHQVSENGVNCYGFYRVSL